MYPIMSFQKVYDVEKFLATFIILVKEIKHYCGSNTYYTYLYSAFKSSIVTRKKSEHRTEIFWQHIYTG